MELGGNITLRGFSELDGSTMIVVKKIIGNYVKRFGDICEKFEGINVYLKPVHSTEGSVKHEIKVKLMDNGNPLNSEIIERNLFFGIDKVMKKIENSIQK